MKFPVILCDPDLSYHKPKTGPIKYQFFLYKTKITLFVKKTA